MILLLSCDDFTDEIIPRFFCRNKKNTFKVNFSSYYFQKIWGFKVFLPDWKQGMQF